MVLAAWRPCPNTGRASAARGPRAAPQRTAKTLLHVRPPSQRWMYPDLSDQTVLVLVLDLDMAALQAQGVALHPDVGWRVPGRREGQRQCSGAHAAGSG